MYTNIENDYTKGNNNYPQNTVKAYQLLVDYKSYHPPTVDSHGVAFAQGGMKNAMKTSPRNQPSNDDGRKKSCFA